MCLDLLYVDEGKIRTFLACKTAAASNGLSGKVRLKSVDRRRLRRVEMSGNTSQQVSPPEWTVDAVIYG